MLRGLGPGRHAAPLDLDSVQEITMSWGWNDCANNLPVDATAMIYTASYFMLREIEVAGALEHELSVSVDGASCTLILPASKKDPSASGTVRQVECFCSLRKFCLPHYMRGYMTRLRKLGRELGRDSDDFPLFPNPQGDVLSKAVF